MKIGIAQINTSAGDFEGNFEKILSAANAFKMQGADCVVFPELAICGVSPKDKAASKNFLEQNERYLQKLAELLPLPAFVSYVRRGEGAHGAHNSLAFVENKKIKAIYDKTLLPNYGIFDEPRNFDAGDKICVIEFLGKRIGLTICEDIWTLDEETAKFYPQETHVLNRLAKENLDLLVNVSASLWSPKNELARSGLLKKVAKFANADFVFCNLVGGNDEAVCAGGSAVLNKSGDYCAILKKFEEDFLIVDTDNLQKISGPAFEKIPQLYSAAVMATRDFVLKSGFKKVLLGLSGGLDSALVATLAVDALGSENVLGVSLPSKYSSSHSKTDAEDLAKNLGIRLEKISIVQAVESAEDSLAEVFKGTKKCLAEENIQARVRGLLLMAISNKFGAMLLGTSNKSEAAVGYSTLYGDSCGGFAPIADIYKSDCYKLCEYINRNEIRIPLNTISKPPSAELRPDQKDSDSLPEYDVLDEILYRYLEESESISRIVERGFSENLVADIVRKVESCEYKRRQFAPAPRLTSMSFGIGRRVSLTDKKNYEFK